MGVEALHSVSHFWLHVIIADRIAVGLDDLTLEGANTMQGLSAWVADEDSSFKKHVQEPAQPPQRIGVTLEVRSSRSGCMGTRPPSCVTTAATLK